MLAISGFLIVIIFLIATMTRKLSVPTALILVPVTIALIAGFGADIGQMMLDGILKVTSAALIPIFAVLYFGIMIDAGVFDPIVKRIIRLVKGDPMKVTVGAAALAAMISLDGDGTTTFIISVSAMYPITRKLGMNPLILPMAVGLSAGVMNLLPWSGPTARVMAVLEESAEVVFNPLIPAVIGGMIWVFFVCYIVGKKERARIGVTEFNEEFLEHVGASTGEEDYSRPKLFWFNLLLTIVLIIGLLMVWMPMPIMFIIGFAIAATVNYPNLADQGKRLASYSNEVVTIATLIFAAGCFTGILTGTEMVNEMAIELVTWIPDSLHDSLPILVAVSSMPLSLVFPTDAYYFGVLPVIMETASSIGIAPVEIGRAALLGQMTVGFPVSPLAAATLVLISVARVNLIDHQKFIFKWAFGSTVVMTIIALITGAI